MADSAQLIRDLLAKHIEQGKHVIDRGLDDVKKTAEQGRFAYRFVLGDEKLNELADKLEKREADGECEPTV